MALASPATFRPWLKASPLPKALRQAAEPESTEEVDLEAALGGGIRKAPAIVAALDEAEAAESGY